MTNTLFNPATNTIFVDMDGVVADFDKYVLDALGRTFSHSHGPGADDEMWTFLRSRPHFYNELPPTPYAFELWDLVNSFGANVEILTAIPRRSTIPAAEEDKRKWINRYFGPEVKVRIGPYSKDKWKHANGKDILIDDRHDNIIDWRCKGNALGLLHHYENYKRTEVLLHTLVTRGDVSDEI